MNCRKVIILDENIIYPSCYKCKRELSPYEIQDDLDYHTIELLKLNNLWLWEKKGKATILMCPNCVTLTKGN